MESTENLILVPTDYSEVADCAINHALKLASFLQGKIILMHVVAKEDEVKSNMEKLQKIADELQRLHIIKISPMVKVGNIFDDIGGVAKEINARLIIMGTHGVKGFQHITGSYAIKVITNSSTPFIVVQKRKIRDGYGQIVLPMDMTKETKQKVELTIKMAQYFNSKVHIFTPLETGEFESNKVTRNMFFAIKELEKNGIAYDTKVAEKSGNFVKQMLAYASSVDADLIAIVNNQEKGIPEFVAGLDERQIITNDAQIPVLSVNPVQSSISGSVLFFK
ncbi:MAG: universal stress protein [Bacteroidetes bacterium]|nr:universal stress protein [Bacteroidota bacterium]MBK9671788.1 universal stress protein [Bacteroidota bacterium]MBK9800819.1 universal stress protein [Bacteroidota bacterium]MBP6412793.1 universal stress protein [Bacteroidia bacterium]